MIRTLVLTFLIPLFNITLYGQHSSLLPVDWEMMLNPQFQTTNARPDTPLQLRQSEKERLDSFIRETYDLATTAWDYHEKKEYTFNENEL